MLACFQQVETISHASIFDLLQPVETPQQQDLRNWLCRTFPKMNDRAAFQLAVQLDKLLELSVFENHIDAVHLLLQQGVPPDIRFDWGTTPLMWANYLGYTQIANLLTAYGASQHVKSFSGTRASDFANPLFKNSFVEGPYITKRKEAIHKQIKAGYLKPLKITTNTSTTSRPKKTAKHSRQIDNGKGIDELFKSRLTKSLKTKKST